LSHGGGGPNEPEARQGQCRHRRRARRGSAPSDPDPGRHDPGNVSIKDGSNSAITVFVPGTLADLKPIYIPIYPSSIQGNRQVTTGTNVSVIAIVDFTGSVPDCAYLRHA
jgi:hypothetical protein